MPSRPAINSDPIENKEMMQLTVNLTSTLVRHCPGPLLTESFLNCKGLCLFYLDTSDGVKDLGWRNSLFYNKVALVQRSLEFDMIKTKTY